MHVQTDWLFGSSKEFVSITIGMLSIEPLAVITSPSSRTAPWAAYNQEDKVQNNKNKNSYKYLKKVDLMKM